MNLFKRLQDILAANLEEMAESCAEPEPVLRQAVREMEAALDDAKRQTARAMAGARLARKELAENEGQAREWLQRAEKALAEGDENLARRALGRKREHDKVAAALRDQAAAAAETSQSLRRQFEAMQVKLVEARRTLAVWTARRQAAQARQGSLAVPVPTDAFARFDHFSRKVEQTEAEADAFRELETGSPDEPRQGLHDELDIEAELEEIKRKVGR